MANAALPESAQVVIIGGGVIGCSVAYHLTKLGWRDVVLLEQGQLSCGTTWHAAGLVGQLRSHVSLTGLIQYSTKLYAELESETGLATGWSNCGSIVIARTDQRMTVLRRMAASARAQGVEVDIISATEAKDKWPAMKSDDVKGGLWLPGDGKANPSDLTQSLAKGARLGGARIFERIKVTGVRTDDGTVTGVETSEGSIATTHVVNCAGQWARALGQLNGVTIPLHSAEHMYVVTNRIEGIQPDLPILRDPDGFIYCKEEVGGLAIGGFEPDAKPWAMNGIPDNFEFALLPDDWDQFDILMQNALHRVPDLQTCGIKKFYNGPESFTPDNNFLLGEVPEIRNYFVGAGFNSMGIASAGGAGKALAEWIVNGAATLDLWPVDIRRFADFNNNPKWLHDRIKETLGLHYAMPWPNRELETARPLRRSPLYDRLTTKGASFGSKMGWERANWFAAEDGQNRLEYTFDRPNWFENVRREHEAVRKSVAVFDQTSFGKLLVQGRDACIALNHICANDINVPIGKTVYTGLLNARGGYESDVSVLRLARDRFLIITGSAQSVHDLDWLTRNCPTNAHTIITDMTSAWSVLSVMGPKSRSVLEQLTRADLTNKAFPFATNREIDLGYSNVIANRMTYVGELGWELIVPTELAVGVYEDLMSAGQEHNICDAGYYALEGLRVEKGYRAWGRELTPDLNPYEAGLSFAVDFRKPGGFIGKEALLEAKNTPRRQKRIVQCLLKDSEPILWGGELLLNNGVEVGEVRSAAYGHTLGASVALALLNPDAALAPHLLQQEGFEVDLAGTRFAVDIHARTPYDPKSERVKSD